MKSLLKVLIVLLPAIFLSGCITYKTVGAFDDYNEVISGTVSTDLLTGGGTFTLKGSRTNLKCNGTSTPPYIIPSLLVCNGQEGKFHASCNDGREVDGIWVATSCTTGYGSGKDRAGERFAFTFGLNDKEAKAKIESLLAAKKREPNLPEYDPSKTRKTIGFAIGTGFIISKNGYLITNYHVVKGSNNVSVKLADGTISAVKKVILDRVNDLALLKIIKPGKYDPISLSSSSQALVGQNVMTYGFPLIQLQGQAPKATFGHINAMSGLHDDIRYMQIDVPIQPGNSGGPLVSREGGVIGITSATLNGVKTLKETGDIPQNVNYAVKIDYSFPMLTQAGVKYHLAKTKTKPEHFSEVVKNISHSIVMVIAK